MRYFYDGRERLVGRRAEYASVPSAGVEPVESDWKVEDRSDIIASDGIPSETTFVWDPISDNLIAVFKAGANNGAPGGGGVDANGGLVRQMIHGSLQYDDPIEVSVADPSIVTLRDAVIPSVARKVGGGAAVGSSNSTISEAVIPSVARKMGGGAVEESSISTIGHLYPIYDEAAAGSLQAVFNVNGEVVSRDFAEGAYGEDEYSLGGAAVDRVAIKATKDDQGNVSSVELTLRTTESLKSATLAAGLRLAAVTRDGEVVRSSSAVPSLFDNNDATAVWKLTASEWNALVDATPVTVGTKTLTPAALSIAATTELRAEAWGDIPVLAAPDWATQSKPVFTSAALPLEVRESLANLSSWLSSIPAKSDRTEALYEVDDLAVLGTERTFGGSSRETSGDPAQFLLGAAFHAQPFVEPLTGKNYVRARWYDPATGTWLTPDPLGYRDSSNLYAFAGGNPVNGRDPEGQGAISDSINGAITSMTDTFITEPAKALGPTIKKTVAFVDNTVRMYMTGDVKRVKRFNRQVTKLSMVPSNVTLGAANRLIQTSVALAHPVRSANAISDELSESKIRKIIAGATGPTAAISIAAFAGLPSEPVEFEVIIKPPAPEPPNRGMFFVGENLGEPRNAAMRAAVILNPAPKAPLAMWQLANAKSRRCVSTIRIAQVCLTSSSMATARLAMVSQS